MIIRKKFYTPKFRVLQMVLLTVTQWFVLDARERDMQFSAGSGRLERRNTLLPGVDLYVVGYK
jgi:hypothetical protein